MMGQLMAINIAWFVILIIANVVWYVELRGLNQVWYNFISDTLDEYHKIACQLLDRSSSKVTARWIDTGSGQQCSECGEIQYGYDSGRHFCSNCGADMRGNDNNGIK